MRPIAIFYHCRLSDGEPHIDNEHACGIMLEQMDALTKSGLLAVSGSFIIGVNGGKSDALTAAMIAPPRATIIEHPEDFRGELPTLHLIHEWAKGHPGWNVLYHHIKGALHSGGTKETWARWRRCMESACVWNWRTCVGLLDSGLDSVGAHWLTPDKYGQVSIPFWGGNFWWATSDYLAQLGPIPETAHDRIGFYQAEIWISSGAKKPRVHDLKPHWPTTEWCHA